MKHISIPKSRTREALNHQFKHQDIKHRQKYRKIASGYQSNVPYGSKFQENSVKDGSKEFWIKNNHIIRKVKRYTISHAHKVGHCLVVEKNEGKFLFLMVSNRNEKILEQNQQCSLNV